MKPLKNIRERFAHYLGKASDKDTRSYQLVAVIDCILNQNARDAGAAVCPAMNWEVLRLCKEYNVGILQMPCPETGFLGLNRTRLPGQSIREALDTAEGRNYCRTISIDVANRIEEYYSQNYRILAILGGNPESPGCAVHIGQPNLLADSGVFMRELQAELRRRDIEMPFHGIRDHNPAMLQQDLDWLKKLFSKTEKQSAHQYSGRTAVQQKKGFFTGKFRRGSD